MTTHRVTVPVEQLENWRNDLSLHGVGDIQTAVEIDALLSVAPAPEGGAVDGPEDDELPGDFLARVGMDGALWADGFRKMALKLGYSDMDGGWLIGWFCNAVMAGYDHAQRRFDPALATREEAPASLCDHGHTDPMALCSDCEADSVEAPAEAGDDVQQTISGETVCGFKVAAWQYLGPNDDAKFGHRYCEHWSTVGNHPKRVVRLFTEDQLRSALLAQPQARIEARDCGNGHQPGCDCDIAEEDVARSKPQAREDEQPVAGSIVYAVRDFTDGENRKRLTKGVGYEVVSAVSGTMTIKSCDAGYSCTWLGWSDYFLHTHPAPDALRVAVETSGFLLGRLEDLEQDVNERDFYGHVLPAASRLRQALAALQAE